MASLTTVQAARILIVDDNRDTADTMAMLLRIQGYDVAVSPKNDLHALIACVNENKVVLCEQKSGKWSARAVVTGLPHHVRPRKTGCCQLT